MGRVVREHLIKAGDWVEDLQGAVELPPWVGGRSYTEVVEEVALNIQLRPFFLLD